MQYTAHYRLPLFESADHPSWLGDWNETMNKIDEAISDLEIGNIPSLAGLIERIVALENSVEADEQIISATTQALTTLVKKSNITLDFDVTHTYTVGELCFYEGDLYKCVVAHTGDWLSTDFTRTTIEQQINDVASGITPDFTSIYQMFAPEFDATQRYMQGAMVMHQNALYVCSRMYDPDFPGADFNTCFTLTNVATQIASLVTSINAVRANVENVRSLICSQTFYPNPSYTRGAVVVDSNQLYFCTKDHDASSYSYIYDDPYFVSCGTVGSGLLNMLDSIAPIFCLNQSYAIGDVVSQIDYYGRIKFYACKTAYTAGAGMFDAHFAEIPSPVNVMTKHSYHNDNNSDQLFTQQATGNNNYVQFYPPNSRYYKSVRLVIKFKITSALGQRLGFTVSPILYVGDSHNTLLSKDLHFQWASENDYIILTLQGRIDTFLSQNATANLFLGSIIQNSNGNSISPTIADLEVSGYFYY